MVRTKHQQRNKKQRTKCSGGIEPTVILWPSIAFEYDAKATMNRITNPIGNLLYKRSRESRGTFNAKIHQGE